ncbi:MAG: hypothetical protein ACR2O8_07400 [Rhizobiaceae bacterium]
MSFAQALILGVQIWGAAGAVVCVLFLFVGVDRVDPAARDAYAFRPLLIPGIVVIWPLVLWRWWALEKLLREGCPSNAAQAPGEDG